MEETHPVAASPRGIRVGFGTWALGGTDWGPVDARTAKLAIARAAERGFRHFDTAEAYGNGAAEQRLGQALRHRVRNQRETLQIATKSVVRPPASLAKHLERSLRRLNTEYVDVYYIHWPRDGIDLRAAVAELERQRQAGRIRAIGLCNVTVDEFHAAAQEGPVAAVQFGYNLLWRTPDTQGLTALPATRVAYSPLAQGLLAREFRNPPEFSEGDHRPHTPLFAAATWPHVYRTHRDYLELCTRRGVHPAALAVYWAARRLDAAVVGGRTAVQIDALADGLESLAARPAGAAEAAEDAAGLSANLAPLLPDLPNLFGYVPTPCRSS